MDEEKGENDLIELEEVLVSVQLERDRLRSVISRILNDEAELASQLTDTRDVEIMESVRVADHEQVALLSDYVDLQNENKHLQKQISEKEYKLQTISINGFARRELQRLTEENLNLRLEKVLPKEEYKKLRKMPIFQKQRSVASLSLPPKTATHDDLIVPRRAHTSSFSSYFGAFEFKEEDTSAIIDELVYNVDVLSPQESVPGIVAHILFMCVRYLDNLKDPGRLQRFLKELFQSIQENIKENNEDIDVLTYWIANCHRLMCDLKQYAGNSSKSSEQLFQADGEGSPEGGNLATGNGLPADLEILDGSNFNLQNFDLSAHQKILSEIVAQTFTLLIDLLMDDIGVISCSCILEYDSLSKENATNQPDVWIQDFLKWTLDIANEHCLDPDLIYQLFEKVVIYISDYCLNEIFIRRDLMVPERGVSIYFNAQQVETWLKSTKNFEPLAKHLNKLYDAAKLIQGLHLNKFHLEKYCLEIESLSPEQLKRVLTLYFLNHPNDEDSVKNSAIGDEDSEKMDEKQIQRLYQILVREKRKTLTNMIPLDDESFFENSVSVSSPMQIPITKTDFDFRSIIIPSFLNVPFLNFI